LFPPSYRKASSYRSALSSYLSALSSYLSALSFYLSALSSPLRLEFWRNNIDPWHHTCIDVFLT